MWLTDEVVLPTPTPRNALDRALKRRRSVREYSAVPLTEEQLSRLLWAAQGVTDAEGLRTAPSAGALYPLELYLITADGLFHYQPQLHRLRRLSARDLRAAVHRTALAQDALREAPAVFVLAAVYRRTEPKYGPERTPRYVCMEIGHAAQNLLLVAAALGLGAVPVGAFHDDRLHDALGLPADHRPLYLVPVGRPR